MDFLFKAINLTRLIHQAVSPRTYRNISNWNSYFFDYLGLSQKDYILKFNNGLKILLKIDANIKWQIYEIILRDCYKLRKLQENPPSTIIDLGANVGVTSLLIKKIFPQSHIYAFEPDNNCLSYLKKNIRLNKFQNYIHPFPLACYSSQAVQELKKIKPVFNKLIGPWWTYAYKNTTTLKQIFIRNKIQNCDLLKIDVEGAEYDILYSLPKSLFQQITRIHVEYHNLSTNNRLNGISLKKFLKNNNYQVKQKKSLLSNIGMLYAVNSHARIT